MTTYRIAGLKGMQAPLAALFMDGVMVDAQDADAAIVTVSNPDEFERALRLAGVGFEELGSDEETGESRQGETAGEAADSLAAFQKGVTEATQRDRDTVAV
jgi:hypothetical protein